MKIIFILFITLISLNLFALDCGKYKIKGEVKEKVKGILSVFVNTGTKSEIVIETPETLEPKLISYDKRPVEIVAEIDHFEGVTKARMKSLESIELRIPNPRAGSLDTGITLLNKMECTK